jgi:hypothetical protein
MANPRFAPSHSQVTNAAAILGEQYRGAFDLYTPEDWQELAGDFYTMREKWRKRADLRRSEKQAAEHGR